MRTSLAGLLAAVGAAAVLGLQGAARAGEAQAGALKLVMMGDSVTLSRSAPEGQKLPQFTEKHLNSLLAGHATFTVVNKGVGSETAAGGLARIDAVLAEEKPQFLTVSYGLNDTGRRDPKWFETQMTSLIARVGKDTQVILLTATPFLNDKHSWGKDPFFADKGGLDAYLDCELNGVTRRLAMAKGLPLIDVHRAFLRQKDWAKLMQADGVHPNAEGNRVAGEYVARCLATYLAARTPGTKAALDQRSAVSRVAQASRIGGTPARRQEARMLLEEAGELCPCLAEIWARLDALEAPGDRKQ